MIVRQGERSPVVPQHRLQHLSDEVRLMSEILGYLIESLETCEIPAPPTSDPAGGWARGSTAPGS